MEGKIINRPEKTKDCMIGGSLLFTSHNCVDVRRSSVINYGVMDKISLSWMRERINIISTYKPYPKTAKGSLLSAVAEGVSCFDDKYWEARLTTACNGEAVVGGDFNLKETDVDGKIDGTGITRSQHTDDGHTFKSDIGDEHRGRTIDNVLSRGYSCKS